MGKNIHCELKSLGTNLNWTSTLNNDKFRIIQNVGITY